MPRVTIKSVTLSVIITLNVIRMNVLAPLGCLKILSEDKHCSLFGITVCDEEIGYTL